MKAPPVCHPPPPPPPIYPPVHPTIALNVNCTWYWQVGPEEESFDNSWNMRPCIQPINTAGNSHRYTTGLFVRIIIEQRAYHGQVKTTVILYKGAAMKSEIVAEFRWTQRDDPFSYYYHFSSLWTPERMTLEISERPY